VGLASPARSHRGVIRPPAVAGLFYPADRGELERLVDALLEQAGRRASAGLRGLVAPHAAYVYSGPVAAAAFALLREEANVALLGPSHFVPLAGMAASGMDAWATPLGEVPVSSRLREAALAAGALVDDTPHRSDHALEVELPFLQRACPDGLEILPLAVGEAAPGQVANVLDALAGLGALLVVSTDLSHYLPDEAARRVDRATAEAVARREPEAIADGAACGVHALRGLVEHARRHELAVELLDLRTSADAGGDPERVVGYGAFALAPPKTTVSDTGETTARS
jgi:AmmeMemoRadiSam system protein B